MTPIDHPIELEERIGPGQPPDEVELFMTPRLVEARVTQTKTLDGGRALLRYLLLRYTNIYTEPELTFAAVQPNGEVAEARLLCDPRIAQMVADALDFIWELGHLARAAKEDEDGYTPEWLHESRHGDEDMRGKLP